MNFATYFKQKRYLKVGQRGWGSNKMCEFLTKFGERATQILYTRKNKDGITTRFKYV